MIDLAIIGSGPAALTAALYASRSGLEVEVFEKANFGGALVEIPKIDNFPGFAGAGKDLAASLKSQAESAGAKISYGACEKIEKSDKIFKITIDGKNVEARSVLVATGSEPIPLDFVPKSPVSYCALCDGPLYKDQDIAVIGGGNSAISEALYLAELTKSVSVFSHSPLRAEKTLIDSLKSHENVKIAENVEITRELLENFAAVFVFIGKRPATTFLDSSLLDDSGYILTDALNMTKIPGLFAAGDVRKNAVRQAVTAAADGASTSINIAKYLKTC